MEGKLGPYQLNTIITGDARELAKAIPDESVDLILHDPPFGIGFNYESDFRDTSSIREYRRFIRWLVKESSRIIRPGGLCFVYQAQPQLRLTWPLFPNGRRIFAACKNFVQMRPTAVQFAYDPVIFWQKSGDSLKENSGRDYHVGNTANTNGRGLDEAGFHKCPRPLTTIVYMLDNFCPEHGIVCDFFGGSGTTAVAAKLTGRKFLLFEIDPTTADNARRRVEMTQPPLFVLQPEQMELSLE